MKKWLFLITLTALYMGIQSLRADDIRICSQGYATFGRLECVSSLSPEPLLDAYFLGMSTLEEIQKNYAERFERIRMRCERKLSARSDGRELVLQFRAQAITTCIAKRGYQEPCVRNEDCIENFCHPDRGTCSAVFTVPIGMAQ